MIFFVFFKQNTAYEMRISDWSSDVCSSDLLALSQGFLVTAILGNPDIVHSGQAFVLAGGSENDLRRATPLLNLIAQRIFHVADDAGMASLMKVACNAKIGRAHVCTPVTNVHLVYRLLLEKEHKRG